MRGFGLKVFPEACLENKQPRRCRGCLPTGIPQSGDKHTHPRSFCQGFGRQISEKGGALPPAPETESPDAPARPGRAFRASIVKERRRELRGSRQKTFQTAELIFISRQSSRPSSKKPFPRGKEATLTAIALFFAPERPGRSLKPFGKAAQDGSCANSSEFFPIDLSVRPKDFWEGLAEHWERFFGSTLDGPAMRSVYSGKPGNAFIPETSERRRSGALESACGIFDN